MSFTTLNKKNLLKAVEVFKIEGIDESNTNAEIINALNEAGASWSNYKKFVDPKSEADEKGSNEEHQWDDNGGSQPEATEEAHEKFDSVVLLKMDRQNARYDIFGYSFTREHPYRAMSEEDAQKIIDTVEGFRIASPKEARNYYG